MQDNLQEVNDIYFLNQRIKEINPFYKLLYNMSKKRYEVHDTSNKHSLCKTFKNYPNIQLIKDLILSKRDNMHILLKTIEEENLRLTQERESTLLDSSNQKIREVLNFQEKQTSSLTREQINKIIN